MKNRDPFSVLMWWLVVWVCVVVAGTHALKAFGVQ